MKRVKKSLIFVFISVLAIFGFNNSVNAESLYNSNSNVITYKTELHNWSPYNSLVLYLRPYGDNGYSNEGNYTAYLTDGETTVELTYDEAHYETGYDLSSSNNLIKTAFQAGSTVTLYEEYSYTNAECSSDPICIKDKIDEIHNRTHFEFEYEYDSIGYIEEQGYESLEEFANQFKTHYKSDDNIENYENVNIYYDETVDDNGTIYSSYDEDSEKLNFYDMGYINIPIFRLGFNTSLSGNLIYGNWESYDGFRAENDSIPSIGLQIYIDGPGGSGYFETGNGTYSIMSMNQFFEKLQSNLELKYNNPYVQNVETVYGDNNHFELTGNDMSCTETGCEIIVVRDAVKNASVPNGVFYTIIPFLIIIAIGGAGIVILKKNKIKE